ncbi:MAG: PDZ domain-containing protein [Acidobacteria bacterium]|nr:PDZ domain-containing protein [Acidobacteriota bacterium]
MKRLFELAVLLILVTSVAAPIAFGAEKDAAGEKERVIKRIFIRDGEVIEVDGKPMDGNDDRFLSALGERTFLGVHTIDITQDLRTHFGAPADQGVLISAVSGDSPASGAGLKAGDVLIAFDGEPVSSAAKLRRLVRDREKGAAVELEVIRAGSRQKLYATLDGRKLELPRIEVRGDGKRYRLERSEESLKKLREFFSSPEWETRVSRLPNCTEIQAKLEVVQQRLQEMEKKLDRMK